jgi:hypothetical protein
MRISAKQLQPVGKSFSFAAAIALLIGYAMNLAGEEPKPVDAPALSQAGLGSIRPVSN